MRAGAGEGEGGFAEADELFGGGAGGGDRNIAFMKAVVVGALDGDEGDVLAFFFIGSFGNGGVLTVEKHVHSSCGNFSKYSFANSNS